MLPEVHKTTPQSAPIPSQFQANSKSKFDNSACGHSMAKLYCLAEYIVLTKFIQHNKIEETRHIRHFIEMY